MSCGCQQKSGTGASSGSAAWWNQRSEPSAPRPAPPVMQVTAAPEMGFNSETLLLLIAGILAGVILKNMGYL